MRTTSLFIALAALAATAGAQDATAILTQASSAMGADRLTSIRYSGTGWTAAVGQSYSPDDDWPRFEVTAYERTMDVAGRTAAPLAGPTPSMRVLSENIDRWNFDVRQHLPIHGRAAPHDDFVSRLQGAASN